MRTAVPSIALAFAGVTAAQVPLSGSLSDATTGPLQSGIVYHTTTSISVGPGQTLTIQPGVVIKFGMSHSFSINGTLDCNGSGLDSVVMTDVRDDSFGGDSNGDGGATAPAPGWWSGLLMNGSSDASQVDGLTVRYAGSLVSGGFRLAGSDAAFSNCIAEWNAGDGWDLGSTSAPTLSDCSSLDNAGVAFGRVGLRTVPNLSGLTAAGNGEDWVEVSAAQLQSGDVISILASQLVNGVVHFDGSGSVAAGASLTFGPGVIVKMGANTLISANGTLRCNGTAAMPVIFTDERDDTAGGDSNADGNATQPAPGYWRGITLTPGSDASTLERAVVKFGGAANSAGFEIVGASPVLRDCAARNCLLYGVDLNSSGLPTIDGLAVTDCLDKAMVGVRLDALEGFSGLQFSGNGADQLMVTTSIVPSGDSVTLRRGQMPNDTIHLSSTLAITSGAELTIEAGCILKFQQGGGQFSVSGTLTVDGNPNRRVVFTDERDDSVGGDSNGDGNATSPERGAWRGIQFFSSSDGSSMEFADVLYSGQFTGAIVISNASVELDRCRIRESGSAGVDMGNTAKAGSYVRLRVEDCADAAIRGIRLDRLQDVEFASGLGNGQNTIVVNGGTVSADVTIEPSNQFNGGVLLNQGLSIADGVSLTLLPGVVLKMPPNTGITCAGALSIRGSFDNPVIVTSARDDSVGGDANGDGGATTPNPGDWRGVTMQIGAEPSIVTGLETRYGGGFQPSFACDSAQCVVREIHTRQSSTVGVRISRSATPVERIIAFGHLGNGIEFTGGSLGARQLTAVGNGGVGVHGGAQYTGIVDDSISWGNLGVNYDGLGAGRVRFSNGDAALAGSDGNIDTDPLFVDPVNGDLRLTETSPCVDTGRPASPLDPDSTRADMGARFFNFCEPEVFCLQSAVLPCEPVLQYEGFASLSSPLPLTLTLRDSPTLSFAIFFYGIGDRALIPGLYGNVCVAGPYQRLAPVPSGGNNADGPCAGTFEVDFNAYLDTGMDPTIAAGSNVIGTFWFRYGAAPGGALFSAAIEMPVCP